MYISIGSVSKIIGISCTTLRLWDDTKQLPAAFRTCGGHRRYKLSTILLFCKHSGHEIAKHSLRMNQQLRAVTYARVSGSKQEQDLERQESHLLSVATSNN